MREFAGLVTLEKWDEKEKQRSSENVFQMLSHAKKGKKELSVTLFPFAHGAFGCVTENDTKEEEGKSFPLFEDGSFFLLDGYILNKKELFSLLDGEEKQFSEEDTGRLCFALFRKFGEKAWEKLNGSFAFALFDGKEKVLYLVRDRLGSRNLYYFNTPSLCVFAGNPGMLKEHEAFPFAIDEQSLWDFLTLQYVPSGTLFSHVRKLAPGSFAKLTFSDRTFCVVKKWWKNDFSRKNILLYKDMCQLLRERLFAAVEEHFNSVKKDVSKGVFLSGGLDSAIIGGIAAKIAHEDLKYFSMGFQEALYDERTLAADSFSFLKTFSGKNLTHHVKVVDEKNTFSLLKDLASSYGEPYADASLLPTSLLCAFARENDCTFALCGDGADELFGGYERYLAMGYLGKLDRCLPLWCKKILLSSGRMVFSGKGCERGIRARGKRFVESMAKSGKERYFSMITHTTEESKKRISGERWKEYGVLPTLASFDPTSLLEHGTAEDLRERASEFDLAHYLPDDCLMKAERAAKSAFLDVRSPFLHNSILDFSLHLPYGFKENGGVRKKILCDAFSDLILPGLPKRKKRGFGVPLAAFFRGGWKEDTIETLLDGTLVEQKFFDPSGIEEVLQEHWEGKKDNSYLLFSLLMAELSLKR